MKCPVCDSTLSSKKILKEATLPSGDKFSYKEPNQVCISCGFEGNLTGKDEDYVKSEKIALKNAIKKIVNNLQNKFKNLLYIERTLDLPRRTLSRWKTSGESSTSSLLLLKMIETFPFLLDVAEKKFDAKYANKALFAAANTVRFESGNVMIFINQQEEKEVQVRPNYCLETSNQVKTTVSYKSTPTVGDARCR